MSDKKIGYVVSLFPCWSETFILNEIIELTKKGYDITIFSIRNDFEEYTQEKAKPYLKQTRYIQVGKMFLSFIKWLFIKPQVIIPWTFKIKLESIKSPKTFMKNVWCIFVGCYFADLVKREGIQHLHAHFATYPSLVALIMSKLSGIDYTLTAHAHDIFLEKTLLKEKVEESKAVATISQYNREYISRFCGEHTLQKIFVVHCGLDLNEWCYNPSQNGHKENVIVCVGRLTNMKGFENLIHALNIIKDQINFKCHIIGDGNLRDKFEKLIVDYELTDKIKIEGVLDSRDVRRLIEEANVFAVPSIWDDVDGQDGIPLVLMEALAIGTPSVASSLSGIPELVIDGQTGFLTKPGDIQQLSQKIMLLLKDKELQKQFSKEGRVKIEEEFNIEKNVDRLEKLFG